MIPKKKIMPIALLFTFILATLSTGLFLPSLNVDVITPDTTKVESHPKNAGFWNLTGSKILVDDADPEYNWTKTAHDNEWCSGNGTWDEPYIIENVYIDGQLDIPETPGKIHSENCISVRNSDKPFIIRNCTLLRSGPEEYDSGIYLRGVKNGLIFNNTINYCGEGVYVDWYSENNTIKENIFIGDNHTSGLARAIMIDFQCINTTVDDNYIFDYYDSIYVGDGSDNCTIKKCYLGNSYMIDFGIHFMYSDYGKIIGNTFAGTYAQYLYEEFVVNQSDSTGTIIENNTIQIVNITGGFGPKLGGGGGFNTLVSLLSSDYTTVAHNVLILEKIVEEPPEEPNGGGDEPTIYGYNVMILIGALGLIILFLRKKKRIKKS